MRLRPVLLPLLLASLVVCALLAACARSSAATPTTRGEEPRVLVVVGEVKAQDMDRFLEGIGTVQALNTVTVRPQVDGKIIQLLFHDGQDVHKGDVLAQIDPRPYESALEQALAKLAQDESQVDYAQKVLARDRVLKNVIDQQTLDQQQATVLQLQSLAKADEAAVSSARLQLEFTKITAPMDGRVGFRLVDEGNIVRAGDPAGLVVLKQIHPVAVVFTLPEKNLALINAAAAGAAGGPPPAVFASDRDNNQLLGKGSLGAIDNQIDDVSGTIKIKAIFANDPPNLWPGQFVNIKLLVSTHKAQLAVPATAIQQSADGAFVYVVSRDSRAVVRPVTVALTADGQAFIERGLELGERVVVDGQYLLQPNALIQEKSAAGGTR
jgi:multidrug efflux system membrane fusion protein